MRTFDIHEATTHLSQLVEQAAEGEPFIIAKAGKPLVKVTSLESPKGVQVRRLGFLKLASPVPDNFDQMGSTEIERLFSGEG